MSRIPGLIAILGLTAIFSVGCSAPKEGDPSTSGTPTTGTTGTTGAPTQDAFVSIAKPIIDKTCLGCHSGAKPKGNIDMSKFTSEADAKANIASIHKMIEELEEKKMPPPGAGPMSDEDRAALVTALKALG